MTSFFVSESVIKSNYSITSFFNTTEPKRANDAIPQLIIKGFAEENKALVEGASLVLTLPMLSDPSISLKGVGPEFFEVMVKKCLVTYTMSSLFTFKGVNWIFGSFSPNSWLAALAFNVSYIMTSGKFHYKTDINIYDVISRFDEDWNNKILMLDCMPFIKLLVYNAVSERLKQPSGLSFKFVIIHSKYNRVLFTDEYKDYVDDNIHLLIAFPVIPKANDNMVKFIEEFIDHLNHDNFNLNVMSVRVVCFFERLFYRIKVLFQNIYEYLPYHQTNFNDECCYDDFQRYFINELLEEHGTEFANKFYPKDRVEEPRKTIEYTDKHFLTWLE